MKYTNEDVFHKDNTYNLKNEETARKDQEALVIGDRGFKLPDDVVDKDAESDIYNNAELAIAEQRKQEQENMDPDKFGYIEMVNNILEQTPKTEKEQFLDKTIAFFPIHDKIVKDTELNDTKKKQLLLGAFEKIFGHQMISFNPETGKQEISMHKPGYVKVVEKKAPENAYHPTYNEKGRPVDPDAPVELKNKAKKNKISDIFTSGKIWPFKK